MSLTRGAKGLRTGERIAAFVNGTGLADYATRGVATPEHVIRMKRLPLILDAPGGDIAAWSAHAAAALERCIADYHAYFASTTGNVVTVDGGNVAAMLR